VLERQPEVQEQNGEDGIIKPGVEEHSERNEEADVGYRQWRFLGVIFHEIS
jgi:hypothetical protein